MSCERELTGEERALIPSSRTSQAPPTSLGVSLQSLAVSAYKSGLFGKFKNADAALVVMAYGHALGINPIASLTSIHSIDGKPVMSGNLMWSIVLGNSEWSWSKVAVSTDKVCKIEFKRDKELWGIEEYTIEEAQKAGLTTKDVWKKFPKAMLFNRCISAGFKKYCAYLGNGLTIYTPEELGEKVNEEGEYVGGEEAEFEVKGGFSSGSNANRLDKMLKECQMERKTLASAMGMDLKDLDDPTDDEMMRIEKLLEQRKAF